MTVPDTESETCEVVAISGVFQKADGKPFTDERAELFIDGLFKWLRDEGFAYGGTYGFIHNDEEHEAFTHHKQHRADRAEARAARLALPVLMRIGDWPRDSEGRLVSADAEHMRRLAREAWLSAQSPAIDTMNQGGQR